MARAVLPTLLSAAWLAAALATLALARVLPGGLWPLFGPVAARAVTASVLRMARKGPVDWTLPTMDTPLGTVPLGLLDAGLSAGLAVVGCIPLLSAVQAYRPPSVTRSPPRRSSAR